MNASLIEYSSVNTTSRIVNEFLSDVLNLQFGKNPLHNRRQFCEFIFSLFLQIAAAFGAFADIDFELVSELENVKNWQSCNT